MKQNKKQFLVLFNASVILAGLKSPFGGSAKLLSWCKKKKILGIVSILIIDEVIRNLSKLNLSRKSLDKIIADFKYISSPKLTNVEFYKKIVLHHGDAHLLASANEAKVNFLVSLDKKHLLILQNKIKKPKIVSPRELIEILIF